MPAPVAAERRCGFLPARLGSAFFFASISSAGIASALRQRDDLALLGEPPAIGFELAANDAIGLGRIFLRAVDEMQQHAAALDMAEEAVAEADALMRAFDQARNVGEDEFAAVDARPRRDWDAAS